jgi:uncharacterized protein YndB with AHSA1/START domain
MHVEVSRYVFAPPDIVWSVLTDWESQADWMVDAEAVEVVWLGRALEETSRV